MQQQYTWFRAWTNFVQTLYGDFKETPYNSQQLNENHVSLLLVATQCHHDHSVWKIARLWKH